MFLNSHGTFDVNSSVIFIGIQVEDHVPLPASVVTIHNFSIVLESFCVGRFLMRLSCDDSPLIVTGNIIGILTFDGGQGTTLPPSPGEVVFSFALLS